MNSSSKKGVTNVDKPNKPTSVLIVGPFAAGKQTILHMVKHGENATMIPRIGADFEKLTINEASILVWSIGGRSGQRALWTRHYERMSAFIFVVDSNDHERIDEAREQLHRIANEDKLREKPILIFANKQDLPNAMNMDQLRDKLNLEKLNTDTKWYLQPSSAIQNQGLQEGFEWLTNSIREQNDSVKPIIDTVTKKNNFMSAFSITNLKTFIRNFI